MKKLLIPLLIVSLPIAASAGEWQTFDKYGNQVFQKDSEFPMKYVDDILTSDQVQVFAAISSRVILDNAELQGYANDVGISVQAANNIYLASKMMVDKANIESKNNTSAFCDQLLSNNFSDKVTKADIQPLNKQAITVNATFYTVISQELKALNSEHPKEYQKILDTHSGDFSVGYPQLDFEQVTAKNWIEHYTNQCASLGGS